MTTRINLPAPPKIQATNFSLQRVQAHNPLRGGEHQVADLGEPRWVCEIETTALSRAQGGEWKALAAKLRGGQRTLMLHDASRRRPLAYIDATDEPWGAPVVIAYDRSAGTIDLRGFIADAELSVGDMIAWDDALVRHLAIVVEPATANAAGEVTLTIEPAPPSDDSNLPAAAILEDPAAEMVVMQLSAPFTAPVVHNVTLQAAQVFRRTPIYGAPIDHYLPLNSGLAFLMGTY